MRALAFGLIIFVLPAAWGQVPVPGSGGQKAGKYFLSVEMQLGYPSVTLENPDGSKAYYDGIGLRGNANIPIYDGVDTDIYFNPGVKYLDLSNTANNSAQTEVANIIGPGAGLAFRYTKFWLGAQYYHLWARHYSTGTFSGQSRYNFTAIDYFAGLYYQFGRLGLGFNYSMSQATINKSSAGLQSDIPYRDSMISIQFTFDTGETLWQIFKGLF